MNKDTKEFFAALKFMEEEREIPQKYLAEKIANAIVVALRKDYGNNENVTCIVDPEKMIFSVTVRKTVVDEITDSCCEILAEDALKIDSKAVENGFVDIQLNTKQFGRIVAQTAKHVIRQGIREVERSQTFAEFQDRNHELLTAVVQQIDPKTGNANVTIGKTETILPKLEQVPDEELHEGDHIKVYVVDVKETEKGPKIMISRTHPGLVRRLFETEVPEIYDGIVEIKSVSREAGSRTKIAVYSTDENVDAVGACIGPRGARVGKVVDILGGEKIDIVKYNDDIAQFVAAALAPADVVSVEVAEDGSKACTVKVPDTQLSLAIGNKGQNARLAAKLTGWKIDIRPESGFYGEE